MISEPAHVHRLLADVKHVLFDFDGPICDIFAGLPAPTIAATLRAYLAPLALDLPPDIRAQADPLEILRYAPTAGPLVAETVEAGLRGLELQAALTATPTPGTANVIKQLRTSGRRLAVVSNNSDAAIKTYTENHGLLGYFDHISARALFQDPALLKPHPYLITQALNALGADPALTALIGDSVTDIQSAKTAGILSIGYANTPGKDHRLHEAGADAIINDMAQLTPPST
ncbi:HAD family hydrolase [Sphaerisporangium sp. NPDC051017]|uniref:HAD family hydrolase n=1 Tax=Sphaerisporangium sp. NPDC051017 TaxID=3154636 RepID=UPI00343A395D